MYVNTYYKQIRKLVNKLIYSNCEKSLFMI